MDRAPKLGLLDLYGETKNGTGARRRAAKDILQAIKDADPDALDMALETHYEECKAASKAEEDDDEQED